MAVLQPETGTRPASKTDFDSRVGLGASLPVSCHSNPPQSRSQVPVSSPGLKPSVPVSCHFKDSSPIFVSEGHFTGESRSQVPVSSPGLKPPVPVSEIGFFPASGEYQVHSVFANYLNIVREGRLIGISDLESAAGPSTIVLPGLEPGWSRRVSRVRVEGATLWLDQRSFDLGGARLYRDRPNLIGLGDRVGWGEFLAKIRRLTCENASAKSMVVVLDPSREREFKSGFERVLLERFLAGARALKAGDWALAVKTLAGLGCGLTPSGDDFLAGALFGRLFLELARLSPGLQAEGLQMDRGLANEVEARIGEFGFFSRGFLRDALAGRWPKNLRDLLEAYGAGDYAIGLKLKALLAHGASSGADLASGFLYLLEGISRD